MARIALKIDVDTLRGTQEGVPRLSDIIEKANAGATFLFSLGLDHTGWALRRVFRPGFLKKVSRTSVLEHYGFKTLMYGVLLPAPDIGKRCAQILRDVHRAGFECGIHTWDHVLWQDNVRHRDAAWTRAQMRQAWERFQEIYGFAPATHGAAGWQMNAHALRQIDDWGMAYASDGRGVSPYRVTIDGLPLGHVQLPTTLPTLDELLGLPGAGGAPMDGDAVVKHLLSLTEHTSRDQVFTLHAELEGGKLAPIFRKLLHGWQAQGHELLSMGEYYSRLDIASIRLFPFTYGEVPGRSGELFIEKGVHHGSQA
ncbi:MAG: polysaccharide deacetylase family protein [Candidatus Protistobacter heckmanni]|nr:polysaccharide deacetylase family protein [Candidatus Protistobacter heckmanni]